MYHTPWQDVHQDVHQATRAELCMACDDFSEALASDQELRCVVLLSPIGLGLLDTGTTGIADTLALARHRPLTILCRVGMLIVTMLSNGCRVQSTSVPGMGESSPGETGPKHRLES